MITKDRLFRVKFFTDFSVSAKVNKNWGDGQMRRAVLHRNLEEAKLILFLGICDNHEVVLQLGWLLDCSSTTCSQGQQHLTLVCETTATNMVLLLLFLSHLPLHLFVFLYLQW